MSTSESSAPPSVSVKSAVAVPGITAAMAELRSGQSSAVELLRQTQHQAARFQSLNPLASVDWDAALATAGERDQEAKAGRVRGPLHGLPISIKDLYKVAGVTMRAGTHAVLPEFAETEAIAVARLRDAGAVIFATTNLHEIALGATGENSWTGDVRNPFDPARQSGGSSSGAGVCVATGIGLAGLGSDTGGSVRIPANFCGVVGFKPTFGAIPLGGALHLSWTCDHAGPLTRNVADARLLYEVMAGRSAAHDRITRAPRLAVPTRWLEPRLASPVRQVFEQTLQRLRAQGAEIIDVEPSALARSWACYSPIVRAEAAYVHRAALAAGGAGFSDSVLQPMLAGRALSAHDYLDALREAALVKSELAELLAGVDAMILPTAAILPPLRGQTDAEAASGSKPVRELVLGQTLPFNVAGVPAVTLPMGQAQGLPVGLQMVAGAGDDARLLALAEWCEQVFVSAQVPMARIAD